MLAGFLLLHYIVYITTIIDVFHLTVKPIIITNYNLVELLLVRYSNACLRLYYKIMICLQRFYINVDHCGIYIKYTLLTVSRAFITLI